ncbi:siderophore-interacting protein [Demequina sp.]|uniref:siderophore-interacting protein n=1 Tax=Demequina sp. TaxID=2050685 RepID=UPI003D0C8A88
MESIYGTTVTARQQVTPQMVRLTLKFDEGTEWTTTGLGDEFIHIDVNAETLDADGHSERHYTVSGLVEGGIEVEVFLHGHGPGATWGREAAIGDAVKISDPFGYYKVPADAGLRVLVGDLTALPAVARILAEASADERFHVVVELPSLSETRDLPTAATATVDWRVGGNGIGPSLLPDIVRELSDNGTVDPAGDEYLWIAGESKVTRKVRTQLRHEVKLPITRQRIVGYWHANAEQVQEAWDALSDDLKAQYMAIWREDRTDEENWLELEPFLQSVGH